MNARTVYSRPPQARDRYDAGMHAALLLPLAFVGVLVAVFLVLILLGRPQGFVRIASIATGLAVVVLGVATVVVWLTGGAPVA